MHAFVGKRTFILAVSFENGSINLLKSYDDVLPVTLSTGFNGSVGFVMEWSNAQQLLAVAGTVKRESYDGKNYVYENAVKFYTACGHHLYTARIPCKNSPVSAITWGHSDKRLFIATGNQVHIAWVSRRVAALQLLCSLQVQTSLGSEALLPMLPLPIRIKSLIYDLYAQTIRVCANATFDFR